MTELGEKTRNNRLQLEDVQDGTFTLDNTGAFGSILSSRSSTSASPPSSALR